MPLKPFVLMGLGPSVWPARGARSRCLDHNLLSFIGCQIKMLDALSFSKGLKSMIIFVILAMCVDLFIMVGP